MEAIWNGSKTTEQGLDDAAERGDKLLRKFERANK
jgi:sn-glycerol 3-phosphate transport system substrate-binding protein